MGTSLDDNSRDFQGVCKANQMLLQRRLLQQMQQMQQADPVFAPLSARANVLHNAVGSFVSIWITEMLHST